MYCYTESTHILNMSRLFLDFAYIWLDLFFICGHHEVPRKHQRSSSLQCNTVRNSSAKKLCPSSHKLWLVRRKALPQFCRTDSCQLWLSFPHTDARQKQYSQSPRLRGFQNVLGFRLLPLLSNYLKHLWVVTTCGWFSDNLLFKR